MTGKRFRYIIYILVFVMVALSAGVSSASEAKLSDMVVSNTRDNLLLYLKVQGAFTHKMKQAILNGIPTTFSFYIKLKEVRTLWPDHTIVNIKVTHTIKYDALKKQFTVKRSWEDNRPLTTDSFAEAQKWMSEIQSLPIIPLKLLTEGTRYQISARAELDKVTLPFYLNYVLFFASLWDFKTDWYSVDFVR